MSAYHTRVLIIGGGPAGCTAAIYAARASLDPIMILGLQPGGQLTITTDVENYPGFDYPIQGPDLMTNMHQQAKNFGTRMVYDSITEVNLLKWPFQARGDVGDTYTGDTVIIATGAKARWLNLESETYFRGFGVSACATCDGFFFRNKQVAVIGGGNTACEEALFLTKFATKVFLIHRRNSFRSEKILQNRVFQTPKIEILWNKVVEEILGVRHLPKSVTGLRIRDVVTEEKQQLSVDGVFVAIGHDPATSLFQGQVDMDKSGYIITTPDSTATSIAGVFAAGDVKDKIFRQAVTAAGMGCMAALEAERWLSHS